MAVNIGVNIQRSANRIAQAVRESGVGGKYPELLLDFDDAYYRANGGSRPLSEVVTHSRSGNATMVDSDGLLKWAPHNLILYSTSFTTNSTGTLTTTTGYTDPAGGTTAVLLESDGTNEFLRPVSSIAVTPETQYTLEVDHRNLSGGTATIGAYDVSNAVAIGTQSITATASTWATTTYTFTTPAGCSAVYIYFANTVTNGASVEAAFPRFYRSDLGGMVDVPAGERSFSSASTYVPTTSSARYLPRVGHHVYNGSAWVNEGVLVESEARTNLDSNSNTFSATGNTTITANQAASPSGETDAALYDENTASTSNAVTFGTHTTVAGTTYTSSVFAKYVSGSGIVALAHRSNDFSNQFFAWFNIQSGTKLTLGTGVGTMTAVDSGIEDWGNGWYRIWTVGTDSTQTTANPLIISAPSDGDTSRETDAQFYIWGTQFEAALTPSSYIPTAGATVTRAAETLTIPAANLPWPAETYGPELVTNGTFDSDITGWSAERSLSAVWSSGAVNISQAVDAGSLVQSLSLTVGKTYIVSADVSNISGTIQFQTTPNSDGTSFASLNDSVSSKTTYSGIFTATANDLYLAITANAGESCTLDNISVRELTRYPVSIQTQGRMTYADTGSSTDAGFVFWQLDTDNRIIQRLTTAGGAVGTVYFTQSYEGTVDSIISASYTPGILVPFNIASRHSMTFINGAVDGVALTEDPTPTNLPDLSATDLNLAYDFMGTVERFRVWGVDLGDTGLETATAPSLEPSLSLTFDSSESSFVVDDWSA